MPGSEAAAAAVNRRLLPCDYHAPQKHYLPEKIQPELFLKLLLPDLSFSKLISKNCPIPSVFV